MRLLISLQLDHMRRAGDRGLHRGGIALLEAVRQIARRLVPDLRRAGRQRGRRCRRLRAGIVVDQSGFGRAARGVAGFGDDEGDRVADMARAIRGQRVARRHDHRLPGWRPARCRAAAQDRPDRRR